MAKLIPKNNSDAFMKSLYHAKVIISTNKNY